MLCHVISCPYLRASQPLLVHVDVCTLVYTKKRGTYPIGYSPTMHPTTTICIGRPPPLAPRHSSFNITTHHIHIQQYPGTTTTVPDHHHHPGYISKSHYRKSFFPLPLFIVFPTSNVANLTRKKTNKGGGGGNATIQAPLHSLGTVYDT